MMLAASTEAVVEASREFTFAQPGWLWALPAILLFLFLRRRRGAASQGCNFCSADSCAEHRFFGHGWWTGSGHSQ